MLDPENNSNIPSDRKLVLQYKSAVIEKIARKHDIEECQIKA